MLAITKLPKKLKGRLSYNAIAILSIVFAYILCLGGILLQNNPNALTINNITGLIVMFIVFLIFLYEAYLSLMQNWLCRLFMCIGTLLVFIEYTASVFLKINLNQSTSIFWCDVGLICIGISILSDAVITLKKLIKK